MSRPSVRTAVAAGLFAAVLWGCGDEEVVGSYAGSIDMAGGAPGAVLLLVTGEGVVDVIGEGGTVSWTSPVEGSGGEALRTLLVDPDPAGALTFRVEMSGSATRAPRIVVLEVADRENELRPAGSDVRVRLTPN